MGGGREGKIWTQNIAKWVQLEEKEGPVSYQFWPKTLIRVQVLKPKKPTTREARRVNNPWKALDKLPWPKDKILRNEVETHK